MARELPDYAFEGMGQDLLFDRGAIGDAVWGSPRAAAWNEAEMSGVLDWVKKGAKVVAAPIKAVGKGVVNAAAEKVGLGPIFKAGAASVVPQAPAGGGALVPTGGAKPNYLPWIIGGGAGLVLLLVLTRKK